MDTVAVVLEEPGHLNVRRLELGAAGPDDVVVDVHWSGVSTGTERLLWNGTMPPFPGLGYPLVPGYEAVGQVRSAGPGSGRSPGDWVFVPGSNAFQGARGLFGASAGTLVTPGERTLVLGSGLRESACMLALAATAVHALQGSEPGQRPLVVGHGALGRLIARLLAARSSHPDSELAQGGSPETRPPPPDLPVVWETNPIRRSGSHPYRVLDPSLDDAGSYDTIYDASGATGILDTLIPRLDPQGEIVLAGFYSEPVHFDFPPAFLREVRIRVAAEWKPADLIRTLQLVDQGLLSLDTLVTHRLDAPNAPDAYPIAFGDPECVKMILDWSDIE